MGYDGSTTTRKEIIMGFFSFKTQDTNRSISNRHSLRKPFTVYLRDPQDILTTYREDNYDGYGVFGGKDIFELIADMNGFDTREEAIKMYHKGEDIFLPILSEDPDFMTDKRLESCKEQGYFYPEQWEEAFK